MATKNCTACGTEFEISGPGSNMIHNCGECGLKVCPGCREIKELAEFYEDKNKPDGHRSECKVCVSGKTKIRRASPEGKAKRRAYQRTPARKDYMRRYDLKRRGPTTRICTACGTEFLGTASKTNCGKCGKKVCLGCGEIKALSKFHKNNSSNAGYTAKCKDCTNAGPTTISKVCNACGTEFEISGVENASKNCGTCGKKVCQTCKEIKDLSKFNNDKRRKDGHASQCRECVHAVYSTPEYKASTKARRQSPEYKAVKHNWNNGRRARKAGLRSSLTPEQWEDNLTLFNNQCVYCHEPFTDENPPTREHIIPQSKGGPYTQWNIVPACLHCNCSKNDKDKDEWLADKHLGKWTGIIAQVRNSIIWQLVNPIEYT